MNALGKLFTMLIFVFSMFFLTMSVAVYATHRNWRQEAANLKKQLDDQKRANTGLTDLVAATNRDFGAERAARQSALAAQHSRLLKSESLLSETTKKFDNAQSELSKSLSSLETAQSDNTRLSNENKVLRQEIRDAQLQRDEKFKAVVALTDKVNQLEGQLQLLEETRTRLSEQLSTQKLAMDKLGVKTSDAFLTPHKLTGLVRELRSQDRVVISLGNDDGLKRGDMLEVTRGKQLIGRLKVEDTDPASATAQVLPQYRRGNIREGDNVATKP